MIIINLLLVFLIFWLVLKALGLLLRWFILYKLNNLKGSAFSNFSSFSTRSSRDDNRDNRDNNRDNNTSASYHSVQDQTLVPCATCGVYIVKTQALEQNNQYYCSKQHLPE